MTRTSKKLKRVVSLLAVVIILCSITITSQAVWNPFDYQRNRAFVAAALAALNIVTQSAVMDTASVVETVADPANVTYTHIDAWQDRPEIQIWDDYTVIDGRAYTDIWLSNEAAEKFRVDAFDFKTAYNITSQSNGTFAQGVGTFDGLPVFNVNGNLQTQNYTFPVGSPFTLGTTNHTSGEYRLSSWYYLNIDGANAAKYQTTSAGSIVGLPASMRYGSINQNLTSGYNIVTTPVFPTGTTFGNAVTKVGVYDPFSFDYVAGDIPADIPLDSDQGMMIRVPSDDGNGNRYFDTFLHDNPDFNQGQPVTIDVNLDPDIYNKLDDLLDIIIPIMPVINNNLGDVTFVTNHTQPQPVPDTLLPDTYWSQLENKLDQIRQTIQNLNPDFSQIIQTIQNIPQSFSQITQPIVQAINNLGDTILKDIEEGPIKLLDKLIDVLRTLFFPILATLKGFLGIWHYVVSWMSNISAPFTWIMGLMAGASPILVSPIYALIAGIIVIAVYRRFGR